MINNCLFFGGRKCCAVNGVATISSTKLNTSLIGEGTRLKIRVSMLRRYMSNFLFVVSGAMLRYIIDTLLFTSKEHSTVTSRREFWNTKDTTDTRRTRG